MKNVILFENEDDLNLEFKKIMKRSKNNRCESQKMIIIKPMIQKLNAEYGAKISFTNYYGTKDSTDLQHDFINKMYELNLWQTSLVKIIKNK